MLMCPSSAPRIDGNNALGGSSTTATAPPLSDNPRGTHNAPRMTASAPNIGGGTHTFTTFSQGPVKLQQQQPRNSTSSSSPPPPPPPPVGSTNSPVKQVLINGSTTIRQKATPPTLLLRTAVTNGMPSDTYQQPGGSKKSPDNSNTRSNATTAPTSSNNTSDLLNAGNSTATTQTNIRNQPKFKLLQRPKLPRGHKPPQTQEAAESFANHTTVVLNKHAESLAGTGHNNPNNVQSYSVEGQIGDGLQNRRGMYAPSYIGSDSDHKEGHSTNNITSEEFHRISLYTANGNTDADAARKVKPVETNMGRSLRERERLYEEAKRRIWTSASRRAIASQNQSSEGQGCHQRGVGDSSPSSSNVAGQTITSGDMIAPVDSNGIMIPPPPPPLYEYEPPYQPGTYYISEDGLESCQWRSLPVPLLTQTYDEYDTRRPVPRGGGGTTAKYGNTQMGAKTSPMKLPGYTGLLTTDGAQASQNLPSPSAMGGRGFETDTQPQSNSAWEGTCCYCGNTVCCCHQTEPSFITQAPIVEPWELVRAEPPPSIAADASSLGRTNRTHNNSTNGPPPLEDDFSFPPLGRTAAADQPPKLN